jgi:hypothetical protein
MLYSPTAFLILTFDLFNCRETLGVSSAWMNQHIYICPPGAAQDVVESLPAAHANLGGCSYLLRTDLVLGALASWEARRKSRGNVLRPAHLRVYLYRRDYNNKESIPINQEGIPLKIITCYLY